MTRSPTSQLGAVFAVIAMAASLSSQQAAAPAVGRTVLVIVADDLGVDQVGAYRERAGVPSEDLPRTPELDRLAAEGVLFRNAYANPICSPTRATVITGRFACRQGVGDVTGKTFGEPFADDELTLPELLRDAGSRFFCAAIGKWHLGYDWSDPDVHHGRNHMVNDGGGFDYFCGTNDNLMREGESHSHYARRTLRRNDDDPRRPFEVEPDTIQTRFSATEQVDSALALLAPTTTPVARDVFVYLCFNVPHEPFEKPPDDLHSLDEQLGAAWRELPPRWDGKRTADARLYYKAMVEAMDTELGRLRRELPTARQGRTTIVLLGDNGTPQQTTAAPFDAAHAKGTLYEGGIHVPLIVAGHDVEAPPGSVVDQLVQTSDVYATVADLAGVAREPMQRLVERRDRAGVRRLDSHSLRPLFDLDPDNDRSWPRRYAFAERFGPNGADRDAMVTIDAQDPPAEAPSLAGYERPQLGAATLHVEGQPFTIGNRARVLLRCGEAGARCRLRITACFAPLEPPLLDTGVLGQHTASGKRFLSGPGVEVAAQQATVFCLLDTDVELGADGGDCLLSTLDGDLTRRLAGTERHLLFQAWVADREHPSQVVAVTNVVHVQVPATCDTKAIRDERFKLICTDHGGKEQLFDLSLDVHERQDLLRAGAAALDPEVRIRYLRLRREIDAIVTGAR